MFLSRASVRRPIAMSCFIIMLVLFGINSWDQLGLDAFPNVEIPYVTVTTVYPGASPAEIEVDVAKRLEDAVGTIDGLKTMNTTCMENVCQITLEFQLGQSVDAPRRMSANGSTRSGKNSLPTSSSRKFRSSTRTQRRSSPSC